MVTLSRLFLLPQGRQLRELWHLQENAWRSGQQHLVLIVSLATTFSLFIVTRSTRVQLSDHTLPSTDSGTFALDIMDKSKRERGNISSSLHHQLAIAQSFFTKLTLTFPLRVFQSISVRTTSALWSRVTCYRLFPPSVPPLTSILLSLETVTFLDFSYSPLHRFTFGRKTSESRTCALLLNKGQLGNDR